MVTGGQVPITLEWRNTSGNNQTKAKTQQGTRKKKKLKSESAGIRATCIYIMQRAMLTSASLNHKVIPHPLLEFGGLGKPALVHYMLEHRIFVIFVAAAGARRGRRNDHLTDAGSITAVVIGRDSLNAASTFGTAVGTSTVDGDGLMRHELL